MPKDSVYALKAEGGEAAMVAPPSPALEPAGKRSPGKRPGVGQPAGITPPPPGCRRSLNPQLLALAAIEIADADGLDAVSMRRLASSLGVGTMTLYYHVRDKDELLGLMWDEFLAGHLLEEIPEGWREGLTQIARRTRRSYQRHPWALRVGIRPGFGPNKLRYIEQGLTVTSRITDEHEDQMRIIHSIGDLVVGCTLREVGGSDDVDPKKRHVVLGTQDLESVLIAQPDFGPRLTVDDLPHMAGLAAIGCNVKAPRFERALSWLLDGIAAEYGLASPPDSPSGGRAPNPTDPKKSTKRPSRTRLE